MPLEMYGAGIMAFPSRAAILIPFQVGDFGIQLVGQTAKRIGDRRISRCQGAERGSAP
jgi:hypothetical protein